MQTCVVRARAPMGVHGARTCDFVRVQATLTRPSVQVPVPPRALRTRLLARSAPGSKFGWPRSLLLIAHSAHVRLRARALTLA